MKVMKILIPAVLLMLLTVACSAPASSQSQRTNDMYSRGSGESSSN